MTSAARLNESSGCLADTTGTLITPGTGTGYWPLATVATSVSSDRSFITWTVGWGYCVHTYNKSQCQCV